MDRIPTGSRVLDAALDGGFPVGTALLVAADDGAGGTEFAMTLLHEAIARGGRHATLASALRSAGRVRAELAALFEDARMAHVDVRMLDAHGAAALLQLVEELAPGDVLVVESADALARAAEGDRLMPLWHELADRADARGVLLVLLHATGTLPASVEASLAEGADAVLRFRWQEGGPARRRVLAVAKLRGLATVLDGDQVPLFEVALERGVGYSVAMEHSVV